MWWGDKGLSRVSVGDRSKLELLNMDEMWKAWEKKQKKKTKKKPDTHVQLLNLNCNEMWTHRKKNKQVMYTHHPVSSEGSLYVACQHIRRVVPVV